MAIPANNPLLSPLKYICSVGHSSAMGQKDVQNPVMAPINTDTMSESNSFLELFQVNFQSRTRVPKDIPKTGPIKAVQRSQNKL